MNTLDIEKPKQDISPKDKEFNALVSKLQDAGYQFDTQEYNRLRREFNRGTYSK